MGISMCLLAYKEADNLKVLLPQIRAELEKTGEDFEIIVIDTQTPTDDTPDVCKNSGARYVPQKEPYFGGAFRTAIESAEYDKFFIMDADGSHKPDYIVPIYNLFMSGADVAIGSRYVKGGVTNDALSSILMSRALNFVFRFFLGIKAKDISTNFRMYRTESLKEIKLRCDRYDIQQEVLAMLKRGNPGICIKETPICFEKRLSGETKRQMLPFIVSYIKTLFRLTRLRFQKNP